MMKKKKKKTGLRNLLCFLSFFLSLPPSLSLSPLLSLSCHLFIFILLYEYCLFLVLAALSVANVVKSSLGPVGLDKMMVDDIGVSLVLIETDF